MLWVPAVSAVVLNFATPEVIAAEPKVTVPFLKVTEPVGAAPNVPVTLAVKVTP